MIYLLILLGLFLSLFTTFVTFKPNHSFAKLFPDICENGSCKKIFLAENARLIFNIPNCIWGIVYHLALALLLFLGQAQFGLFFTIPSIILSTYLTYRLIFVHKVLCKICLSSHLLNLAVFSWFLHAYINH